eukprot:GILJ01005993.1.p1 GENE.GILJ01005993.1~~GILJ01005993.1.p1  ORF type:complete len:501 (+),score=34.47 GILJ01005993.1:82-1584(+)
MALPSHRPLCEVVQQVLPALNPYLFDVKSTTTTDKCAEARNPPTVESWKVPAAITTRKVVDLSLDSLFELGLQSLPNPIADEDDLQSWYHFLLGKASQVVQCSLQKPAVLSIIGRPDRVAVRKGHILFPVEIKHPLKFSTNDLIEDYRKNIKKVRNAVRQVYGYMCVSHLKYGVLTTYNYHWFLKRSVNGTLYISQAHGLDTSFATFVSLILLSDANGHCGSPPLSPIQSEASISRRTKRDKHFGELRDALPMFELGGWFGRIATEEKKAKEKPEAKTKSRVPYSRPPPAPVEDEDEDEDDSCPHDENGAPMIQLTDEMARTKISVTTSQSSERVSNSRGKSHRALLPCMQIASTSNCSIVRSIFNGVPAVIKCVDVTKTPDQYKHLQQEIRIYHKLVDIQGKYIPRLLAYGWIVESLLYAMVLTDEGVEIGDCSETISSSQIYEAIDAIHRHHIQHNDLEARNILMRPDGTYCVIDFGLAEETNTINEPIVVEDLIAGI